MAIDPKCDHTLCNVLTTKTKTLSNTFALINLVFIFLFLLFKLEFDHLQHMSISVSMDFITMLHHLVCTNLAHMTLMIKVST